MNYDDEQRLYQLRCAAKRGQYISPDDMKFCEKMFKKYPEEYKQMDERVFEATKPFGS